MAGKETEEACSWGDEDEVIRITAFILLHDITKNINESRYCFIIK